MASPAEKFRQTFLVPQGGFLRWFSAILLWLTAASSVAVYVTIVRDICADGACDGLVVTRFWVLESTRYLYLLHAACAIVLGVFVVRARSLSRLVSYALGIGFGVGGQLSGMAVWAILRELAAGA
ncbi:MAG: hypothetical protein KDH20_13895 [Rhodocyclaceae bacterium]|nr:hypothetical protein [Rhodocyclaceae bacterium]